MLDQHKSCRERAKLEFLVTQNLKRKGGGGATACRQGRQPGRQTGRRWADPTRRRQPRPAGESVWAYFFYIFIFIFLFFLSFYFLFFIFHFVVSLYFIFVFFKIYF